MRSCMKGLFAVLLPSALLLVVWSRHQRYHYGILESKIFVGRDTLGDAKNMPENLINRLFSNFQRGVISEKGRVEGLTFFDQGSYEKEVKNHPMEEKSCMAIDWKVFDMPGHIPPPYRTCLYDDEDDLMCKVARRQHGVYSKDSIWLILQMLKAYSSTSSGFFSSPAAAEANRSVVFLDVGGHVGFYALPMVSAGYQTWTVDPILGNNMRMILGGRLSGNLHNLHLVNNALDDSRHEVTFMYATHATHKGRSRIVSSDHNPEEKGAREAFRTVLLTDVVAHILQRHKDFQRQEDTPSPLVVVLKIDVEMAECRVMLGSREILTSIREVFVPYIVMEWAFSPENVKDPAGPCPPAMLREFVSFLSDAGYTMRSEAGVPLNETAAAEALLPYTDTVVWQHRLAIPIL